MQKQLAVSVVVVQQQSGSFADIEPRLDHHCARLRPSGTLSRAALVRSLLNAGLKQLDEEERGE